MKALLIHRMDNLDTAFGASVLNHYVKHMKATGLDVTIVADHMTVEQMTSSDPATWLRVALKALADVDVLVTIDTIDPDPSREVLRMAAKACGHAQMVAERYCPPFIMQSELIER